MLFHLSVPPVFGVRVQVGVRLFKKVGVQVRKKRQGASFHDDEQKELGALWVLRVHVWRFGFRVQMTLELRASDAFDIISVSSRDASLVRTKSTKTQTRCKTPSTCNLHRE